MYKKILNNAAFSLLEILLASIIFIITVAGVFVTLNVIRKPVADRESALSAALFGKQVLDSLRSQVDAGNATGEYYGNCSSFVNSACVDFSLYLGPHQVPVSNFPPGLNWPSAALSAANVISGVITLSYTVSCGDGSSPSGSPPICSNPDIARKVDLSINWTPST